MLINFTYLVKKYNLNIKGILHIGAHLCEESEEYKKNHIANVIWIEAIKEKADECRKKGHIVYNIVATDVDNQEVTFKITNNYQSSSILELKEHLKEHPEVLVVEERKLTTTRVDTLYKNEKIDEKFANFINIDIQGVELIALKGMGKLLDNIDYIYTEVNKKEIYEGCCLISDLDSFLSDKGFKRVETKILIHGWGDALYIRK